MMAFTQYSQLDVAQIQTASEEYDEFVQATYRFGHVTLEDFRKRHQMPVNAECSCICMTKTSHLKENDFIEIAYDDRIQERLGPAKRINMAMQKQMKMET